MNSFSTDNVSAGATVTNVNGDHISNMYSIYVLAPEHAELIAAILAGAPPEAWVMSNHGPHTHATGAQPAAFPAPVTTNETISTQLQEKYKTRLLQRSYRMMQNYVNCRLRICLAREGEVRTYGESSEVFRRREVVIRKEKQTKLADA
ncbi:hypothetical protein FIBSPDRAFT_904772 [Athelia psychrophila]|uniref:Uncharacterized protein n=1 Tax=Athelia psychrophila TaxID=1759441 RepID=A0A167UBB2_9AGAM|nr:hypothetical protein FIBSPDRAFT_904772 [Fibularhizoctonia sp. CBS 109695]